MNGKDVNIKEMRGRIYSDILDELYFVTSFEKLSKKLNSISPIEEILWEMIEIDLVKVMVNFDEEIELNKENFEKDIKKYHYIASKKGLKWHNSL